MKFYATLLTGLVLFTACNDESTPLQTIDTIPTTQSLHLSGKATLANAEICIDTNNNYTCDEDEQSVQSDDDGSYELEYQTSEDSTQIIATGGFNLIMLEQNNKNLAFSASLQSADETININTLTTLVVQDMQSGSSYEEAIANIATRYTLDESLITQDPLDTLSNEHTQSHFLTIRAIQENYLTANLSSALSSDAGTTHVITAEDADAALVDTNIFDFDIEAYLMQLADIIRGFFIDLLGYFGLSLEDNTTLEDVNVSSLDPFVQRLHVGGVENMEVFVEDEDAIRFLLLMRSDNTQAIEKNYADIEWVRTHTQDPELQQLTLLYYSYIGG